MSSEATYKLVKVLTKSFEFLWGVCVKGVVLGKARSQMA